MVASFWLEGTTAKEPLNAIIKSPRVTEIAILQKIAESR